MIENILKDIEEKINDNEFNSKIELISYINNIRNTSDIDIELFNSKVGNLLSLYDTLINNDEKHRDTFKENKDNNDIVPLTMLDVSKIDDEEVLDKIRFYLGNSNVDPYEYKVDITNGTFINITTEEISYAKKDINGKFNIVKYNPNNEFSDLSNEELMSLERRTDIDTDKKEHIKEELEGRSLNKPKMRILRLNPVKGKDAAFINYSLLSIVIVTSSVMIALMLLLLK